MELRLNSSYGLPDGCQLSVRFGHHRKQLVAGPDSAFKFPTASGSQQMKVEVWAPIAQARLITEPHNGLISLPLDALHARGPSTKEQSAMSVDFDMIELGSALKGFVQDSNPNAAGSERSLSRPSSASSLRSNSSSKSATRHLAALDAAQVQPYFEEHQLMIILQAMVQAVIKEKPVDPYAFMIQMLMNSQAAAEGKPRKLDKSQSAGKLEKSQSAGGGGPKLDPLPQPITRKRSDLRQRPRSAHAALRSPLPPVAEYHEEETADEIIVPAQEDHTTRCFQDLPSAWTASLAADARSEPAQANSKVPQSADTHAGCTVDVANPQELDISVAQATPDSHAHTISGTSLVCRDGSLDSLGQTTAGTSLTHPETSDLKVQPILGTPQVCIADDSLVALRQKIIAQYSGVSEDLLPKWMGRCDESLENCKMPAEGLLIATEKSVEYLPTCQSSAANKYAALDDRIVETHGHESSPAIGLDSGGELICKRAQDTPMSELHVEGKPASRGTDSDCAQAFKVNVDGGQVKASHSCGVSAPLAVRVETPAPPGDVLPPAFPQVIEPEVGGFASVMSELKKMSTEMKLVREAMGSLEGRVGSLEIPANVATFG